MKKYILYTQDIISSDPSPTSVERELRKIIKGSLKISPMYELKFIEPWQDMHGNKTRNMDPKYESPDHFRFLYDGPELDKAAKARLSYKNDFSIPRGFTCVPDLKKSQVYGSLV